MTKLLFLHHSIPTLPDGMHPPRNPERDVLHGGPLGGARISRDEVAQRDVHVELVRVRVSGRVLLELLDGQGPVQGDQENAL